MGDPEGWNMAHPERFFDETVREIELRNQLDRFAEIDRELRMAPAELQVPLLQEQRALRVALAQSGVMMKKATRSGLLEEQG